MITLLLAAIVATPQGGIPDVGDRLPAFTATDQQGRARTLRDLAGPKGLVLVFFRSADW